MKTKTYFLTLLLFLLFFNGSIVLVSVVSLRNSMDSARSSSSREHDFISLALAEDLKAVEARGSSAEQALRPLIDSYARYYGKQSVYLEAFDGNGVLYSNFPQAGQVSGEPGIADEGERIVRTLTSQGREYIQISGFLPEPYDSYVLAYYYDFTGSIMAWNRMTAFLFVSGMVISALLAVSLGFLLNRVFRPLNQVAAASRSIAGGDYGSRLAVYGNDELAEVAKSFNGMADEVQDKIARLADAAEQRQRFIDNFAHELRTPLTSIYGYAEYMQKTAISDEDKLEATNFIMSESLRLQNIAYRLLDLASIRTGEIVFLPVDVDLLFQSAIETLATKAAEKQVVVEKECEFEQVTGDQDLLQSLVVNLTENAIKACASGGRVKLSARMENGKKVISVQDNGKGMTQEQIGHITDAFYRVDKSRSRGEGGVGLGLSLCRQIVERHGAELCFDSRIGQGTTAKVVFKLHDKSATDP